jgi:DNA polymerase-3 subunit gamma/tau
MIEKSLEKEEVVAGEDYSNLPRTPFTIDNMYMYWRRFASLMRQNGEETVALAMGKRDPKLMEDFVIHHEVDNQIQLGKLESLRPDIQKYLRENLKNWGIELSLSQIESSVEDTKLLTGKDKFEALKKKNANLTSFQRMFNLDVEY